MAETKPKPAITQANVARIVKLLEVAKDLQAKQQATLDEIDNILGGRATIGERMRALEKAFDAAWCSRYAPGQEKAYVWTWSQDAPNMKRILKTCTDEDLAQRALRYIRSEDPFFVKSRHTFGLFHKSINQWAPAADAPDDLELDSAPSDCRHTPRCKDDAAHTKRKQQELRASA